MADADETRLVPEGQARVHDDEDDSGDNDEGKALPNLGDIDYAHDDDDESSWVRDGVPVVGEIVYIDRNAPDVPLTAIRANPRVGELRVHQLAARYGQAVGNLSLAQTQRVIFERRIRDLEYLELRRPTRIRDHIIAQEL